MHLTQEKIEEIMNSLYPIVRDGLEEMDHLKTGDTLTLGLGSKAITFLIQDEDLLETAIEEGN